MERIEKIVNEYNKHTIDLFPVTFFTVMAWAASQGLIEEIAKAYVPEFPRWQLSIVEIFVATFGLWFIGRTKNGGAK